MIIFLLLTMPSFAAVATVCPVRCTCVVKDSVACQDKAVTDIATFNIPHNFTYVRVSGTQATELTESSFQQMPFTVRLFLQSNRFSIIRPGTFQKFPLLKTLRLSKNNVSSLTSGIFNTLIYLEHLFLDENVLSYLDPSIFNNLSRLEILNLSINKLQALPKNIFKSLSKLTHLILTDNLFVEIPHWMFDNLMELVELHLHSNLIEIIDKQAFYQLPKLNRLSLQQNRLKTLGDGLFLFLQKLEELSLYENPLTELPNVLFGKIDTLRSLRLWGTSLSTIPNFIFSNLTNLENLILTKNRNLHSLPSGTFSGLSRLVILSLHTNNITSLPEELFQDLPSLQVLSLYNNHFEGLSENLFKPLLNLETVYLNNSKIMTLPGNIFKLVPTLQRVRLDGNPWMCDCRLQEFKMWLVQNVEKVYNSTSLVCHSPSTLAGIAVLKADELVCPYTTMNKVDSYVSSTPASSWLSFTSKLTPGEEVNSTVTDHVVSGTDVSMTDPSLGWHFYNASHNNQVKKAFRYNLPYGNIIYCVVLFNLAMQIFYIFVTCFSFLKIRKLYKYFHTFNEPVVLVRMLIPISAPSTGPNTVHK